MNRADLPQAIQLIATHIAGDKPNEQIYYLEVIYVTIATLYIGLNQYADNRFLVDLLDNPTTEELFFIFTYFPTLFAFLLQSGCRLIDGNLTDQN